MLVSVDDSELVVPSKVTGVVGSLKEVGNPLFSSEIVVLGSGKAALQ